MWHKNNREPRTVPCGTPESTVTDSDSWPSTTTFIFLFVKKSHIQALMLLDAIQFHLVEQLCMLDGIKKQNKTKQTKKT